MNGISPCHLGHANNFRDRQISRNRPQTFAHLISLVCLKAVQRQLIFLGIDRHGAFSQLIGRAHDADGNLTAVGDQDFLEFGHVMSLGSQNEGRGKQVQVARFGHLSQNFL